jgi:chorismate mutase/prephenate dehydratase
MVTVVAKRPGRSGSFLLTSNGYIMQNELYIQKTCAVADLPRFDTVVSVGIHGILGSFNDEAWHRFATEQLHLNKSTYAVKELVESERVLRAVSNKEVDVGIFAFANSGSGGYVASVEAMGQYNYRLLAQFTMPINMCLLAHPSVKSMEQIEVFYGHPVALSQCRKTLVKLWPYIPLKPATDEMDTALSAKLLASGEIPKTHAIFASRRAAELYGLTLLKEGVHHDPNNATAFAIIKHV